MATMSVSSTRSLARVAPVLRTRPKVVARRMAHARSTTKPTRLVVRVVANGRSSSRAFTPCALGHGDSKVSSDPSETSNKDVAAAPEVSPATARIAAVTALATLLVAEHALAAEFAPAVWATSAAGGVKAFFTTPEANELYMFTLKVLISWGVPAVVVAAGAFFVFASSRKGKGGGDDGKKEGGPFSFLSGRAGVSSQTSPFIVKRLNDKLDSYAYAFTAATVSPESADRARTRRAFNDKYAAVLGKLTTAEREAVTKAADRWRSEDGSLRQKMAVAARRMRANAAQSASSKGASKHGAVGDDDEIDDAELERAFPFLDADEAEDLEERLASRERAGADKDASGDASGKKEQDSSEDAKESGFSFPGSSPAKSLASLAAKRAECEVKYVAAVAAALPAHKRGRLAKLLSDSRMSPGWEGDRDSLAVPAGRMARQDKKHVFVLNFFGDVQASQAASLREEVTAVLRQSKKLRGDEVVLVLNTGGGTVTGYGLAAAQLTRLRDHDIKLTICVEQVAASGGYMMACCADRLVASPFAVLGSIGVISEIPNVYERLKKEGIEFQTVTAGKFKRTLTPTKKVDPLDLEKSKKDIEQVLVLFKTFVASQRPSLDIDLVATGETWFGADALAKGLCDELKTTDDVLLDMLSTGAEIFSVKYKPNKGGALASLTGGGDASVQSGGNGGWGALRALALGVAGFAGAAGGLSGDVMKDDFSGLGGLGGLNRANGGALAMDATRTSEKVMARDGRYGGDDDEGMYF